MHALVFWLQDEQLSVVDANNVILDGTNSTLKEGITYPVKWIKGKERQNCALFFAKFHL